MTDPIKKEELADNKSFNQHNCTRRDDGQQADDIQDPKDVQDHVSRTSQGSLKDGHFSSSSAGAEGSGE